MKNFVVFGASGDLAQNYLFPALKNLYQNGQKFNYFGYGRSIVSSDKIKKFGLLGFTYVQGSYDQTGLTNLASHLFPDTIYYLALPIELNLITNIINSLRSLNLINSSTKIIVEKPFGSDYTSALQLRDFFIKQKLQDCVYLVDHYLTKNLIKNIVSLRFANSIFKNLWNGQYIKEINITATESQGIDSRGSYYDQAGAIRDMVQNHLLQLLTLVTMNEPSSFEPLEFISKKIEILKAIKIIPSSVQIGQYHGYLKEVGVRPNSKTETLAKLTLKVNLPNWKNVPIHLATGKKLDQKITEINIVFRSLRNCLWGKDCQNLIPNQLTITLQPKNDIILTINSSFNPHKVLPQPMTLHLGSLDTPSSAYENIIIDVMDNIKINTPSFEEILLQWQIVDRLLKLPHLSDSLFCY